MSEIRDRAQAAPVKSRNFRDNGLPVSGKKFRSSNVPWSGKAVGLSGQKFFSWLRLNTDRSFQKFSGNR